MAAEEEAGGHTAVFLVFCEHALFFFTGVKGVKVVDTVCAVWEKTCVSKLDEKQSAVPRRTRCCIFAATMKLPASIGKRNVTANSHRFKIIAVCFLSLASRLSQKWAWDFQSAHQAVIQSLLTTWLAGINVFWYTTQHISGSKRIFGCLIIHTAEWRHFQGIRAVAVHADSFLGKKRFRVFTALLVKDLLELWLDVLTKHRQVNWYLWPFPGFHSATTTCRQLDCVEVVFLWLYACAAKYPAVTPSKSLLQNITMISTIQTSSKLVFRHSSLIAKKYELEKCTAVTPYVRIISWADCLNT